MKNLRSCHPVDILCFPVRFDQHLISGKMGKNTQFNLRIIRIQKYKTIPWNKYFSDQTSQFHTHRDILQIRFRTADSSCRSDRLIKS